MRDQHVAAPLGGCATAALVGSSASIDTGDLALGVTGEQPDTVPLLGPLGRETLGDRALDVTDGDAAHSAIDLQPPDPSGNATLR